MDRLSDISTIKDILTRHGFSFSKAMGQNFLINPSVCPKMAQMGVIGKDSAVLEIGPGIGVLTTELCRRAKKVAAIELDKRLLGILDETLKDFDNVKIINADVLKLDLNELIKEEFGDMEVTVCANLPYYITSPIIMKLLEDRLNIKSITVMVQKEAARRMCAELGTRQCGAVSAAVRYFSTPEVLFDVSRGSFMPAPNVDSSVIRLNIKNGISMNEDIEKTFFKVVKAAFAQRRKTVINSLSAGLAISKAELSDILEKCNIQKNARAEQLLMEDFTALSSEINKYIKDKNQ